ncbi:unnamed protein product [Nyctereutes procyonoides]|uniref:(raccoon dog) hypothetical protein n=1 Tax=Nyctereutes procyonoides TaxID=34880 RepID=A0A811XUR6_NYCPR|nr:unnamed protein product [Nyctereutes procyonoides]
MNTRLHNLHTYFLSLLWTCGGTGRLVQGDRRSVRGGGESWSNVGNPITVGGTGPVASQWTRSAERSPCSAPGTAPDRWVPVLGAAPSEGPRCLQPGVSTDPQAQPALPVAPSTGPDGKTTGASLVLVLSVLLGRYNNRLVSLPGAEGQRQDPCGVNLGATAPPPHRRAHSRPPSSTAHPAGSQLPPHVLGVLLLTGSGSARGGGPAKPLGRGGAGAASAWGWPAPPRPPTSQGLASGRPGSGARGAGGAGLALRGPGSGVGVPAQPHRAGRPPPPGAGPASEHPASSTLARGRPEPSPPRGRGAHPGPGGPGQGPAAGRPPCNHGRTAPAPQTQTAAPRRRERWPGRGPGGVHTLAPPLQVPRGRREENQCPRATRPTRAGPRKAEVTQGPGAGGVATSVPTALRRPLSHPEAGTLTAVAPSRAPRPPTRPPTRRAASAVLPPCAPRALGPKARSLRGHSQDVHPYSGHHGASSRPCALCHSSQRRHGLEPGHLLAPWMPTRCHIPASIAQKSPSCPQKSSIFLHLGASHTFGRVCAGRAVRGLGAGGGAALGEMVKPELGGTTREAQDSRWEPRTPPHAPHAHEHDLVSSLTSAENLFHKHVLKT